MSRNGSGIDYSSDNAVPRNGRNRRPPRRTQYLGILGYLLLLALFTAAGGYVGWRTRHHHPIRMHYHLDLRRLVPHRRPAPPPPAPALPPVILPKGDGAIPIIMYHDVLRRPEVWFDMTTREFSSQMEDLEQAGAHPISLQALYDHLLSNKPVPDHSIVLTFDDCTLGQFTDALPILLKHHFPATFFVQTASVGIVTGKKHMTWDQLKQAEATGLITVESHTVTHPEDITLLKDKAVNREMQASRALLEKKLGHPVLFLAYPSGHCDARIGEAAQRAGYLAAVTMDRGWAACPAQSYFLPRFAPARLTDVLNAWAGNGPVEPPLPRLIPVPDTPLQMGTFEGGEVPVEWVAGGDLGSITINSRKTVGEMALANGVQAALNGTFFADARVQSEGSAMIGPVLSRVGKVYKPDTEAEEVRIEGRPLVLVGDHRCMILPFEPHLGHTLQDLQFVMPDVKDAFLAGGWIVHYGAALSPDLIATWSTKDANDPRHRAFVGIDGQGRYILGATQDSVSTLVVARTLEKMGVQEAFLLDSGFSTSLIWENRVLVSGHSRKDVPSRPVPHALFLFGKPAADAPPPPEDAPAAAGAAAATTEDALAADSTSGAAHYARHRHRRRRRITF